MNQYRSENKFDLETCLGESDLLGAMGSLQGCQDIYSSSLGFLGGCGGADGLWQDVAQPQSWDLLSFSNIQQPSSEEVSQADSSLWSMADSTLSGSLLNTAVDYFANEFAAPEAWSPSSTASVDSDQTPKQFTSDLSDSSEPKSVLSSTSSRKTRKPKLDKATRLEKRREKNRTSQRKFRERKEKYIQELEEQCRVLQERHNTLLLSISRNEVSPSQLVPWNWRDNATSA